MKKKFLILLCVIGLSFTPFPVAKQEVHAQFVVSDPGHTIATIAGWIKDAATWVTQLKEMADAQFLREALQGMEAINQIEALLELAQLVDDVACLSADFNFYLNMDVDSYSCLKFINFQKVTVNLKLSSDFLEKIISVSSFFSMNSEGRMAFITQAKEALEASADLMKEFNGSVRFYVVEKSSKNYMNTYYNGKLAAFNRYTH